MSRKSRDKEARRKKRKRKLATSKPASPATAAASRPVPATGARTTTPPVEDEHHAIPDDVVHVPKGKSRAKFFLTLAVMVFALIFFIVPGAFQTSLVGGRGDPVVLTWVHPSGEEIQVTSGELLSERRGLNLALGVFERTFPFLRIFLGIQDRSLDDQELARLIVQDRLAEEAGIVITDADLTDVVVAAFGSADLWRSYAGQYGSVLEIEKNLRRLLRVKRYVDILAHMATIADPEEIESLWAEEHVELAFDYVELEVASLVAEAKLEEPADEVLQEWLDAKTGIELNAFMDPERYRYAAAVYRGAGGTQPAGLLEKYPGPEGVAPEARAEDYYNQVSYIRFERPQPEETPPADEEDDVPAEEAEEAGDGPAPGEPEEPEEPQVPQSTYLSFDEVKDVCVVEGPVWFAMAEWLRDVRQRIADGEELDLAAEAAALGLEYVAPEEPQSSEEIRELDYGGQWLGGAVVRMQPGDLVPTVVAEERALVVVRLDEKIDRALPPLAEIRDEVLDEWAKGRASELALEKLTTLRDGFFELVPEEDDDADAADDDENDVADEDGEPDAVRRQAGEDEFRQAALALGYEVGRRDWLDKAPSTRDPDADVPVHRFLRSRADYNDLEDGEVPEPESYVHTTFEDGKPERTEYAYLVRVVGRRDMDLSRMTPADYEGYKSRTAFGSSNDLRTYLTGADFNERYGVRFIEAFVEEPEEGEPGDDEAADAGE